MADDSADKSAYAERFQLRRREDILSVLRQLVRGREFLTVYFNRGQESLVSTLLDVDADAGELELDQGPDERANRRAQAARGLVCLGREGNISVRFRLERLWQVTRDDGPAFRAPLPDGLYRLQRREFFRVPMPVSNPVRCTLHDPATGEAHTFRAADLSLGGVGLVDSAMALPMALEDVFSGCELHIPGQDEPIQTDLRVRNISRHAHRDGSMGRRIGFAFCNISAAAETILQRYLQRVQIALRNSGR